MEAASSVDDTLEINPHYFDVSLKELKFHTNILKPLRSLQLGTQKMLSYLNRKTKSETGAYKNLLKKRWC